MTDTNKATQRLTDRNFGVASFRHNRWAATLDESQTLDDAMDPGFWASQSDKVMGFDKTKGRGDIIEIRKPDTGLYAELIIAAIGKGYVKTELLMKHEPKVVTVAKGSPLTTRWNVGRNCHEVIRESDKTVMQGGFQSKGEAAGWIAGHLKEMAA